MKFSPLQLVHSQFTAISIMSNDISQTETPSSETPYPAVSEDNIETNITLGLPDDNPDPHDFVVLLGVSSSDEAPTSMPYRFAVQIEGVFHIDHDGDAQERKRMVVINGASMLFGIIREQILTLTMRHKNGPLLLPSLDFRVLTEDKQTSKPKTKGVVKKSKANS